MNLARVAVRVIGLATACLVLAGCVLTKKQTVLPQQPTLTKQFPQGANEIGYQIVKVGYATDRDRTAPPIKDKPILYGTARGPMEYGQALVSFPSHRQRGSLHRRPTFFRIPLRAVDPLQDVIYKSAELMTEEQLFQALQPTAPNEKAVLLFVHGYNVSFEDAILRAGQLQLDLGFPGKVIAFTWPSNGLFLDYFKDSCNAGWAAYDLSNLLVDMKRQGHISHIVILAHSMGNEVVSRALRTAVQKEPDLRSMITNVIMAAPDVDAAEFRRSLAPAVLNASQAVTMYVSSRDKALDISESVNGYPRAGDDRDGPVIISPIDTVDASDVDMEFLGHSYVATSPNILDDVSLIVDDEMTASKRPKLLREVTSDHLVYWRIQP